MILIIESSVHKDKPYGKEIPFIMASFAYQNRNGFLIVNVAKLLERFSISYEKNDTCIEYFLYSKEKFEEISKSLILSHELFSKSLYVSKFYPEIYKELNCKYLSAACFYMIARHAIEQFHLSDNCCVNLEADRIVFTDFYSKLKDFDFKVQCSRPGGRICLRGRYREIHFSTEMIKPHTIV